MASARSSQDVLGSFDLQAIAKGRPLPQHRSESGYPCDGRHQHPMKVVGRKRDLRQGILHEGASVRVFSRSADAWVDGEVVKLTDDFVRVEYEVDELWCGKLLHPDSDDVHIPASAQCCARSKEESLCLGVSVAFLLTEFLSEVEDRFGPDADPNYYQINEVMLFGCHARGFGVKCPRDGLPGCSYADALDHSHTGCATVMLSWCWRYTVRSVVTALARWCERTGRDMYKTYVWQCALCNNQFRIQENNARGVVEPFDVFRDVFETRVRTTGHILALMSPWQHPTYIDRIWCIFEFWVAMTSGCELDVILPEIDEDSFLTKFTTGGLHEVWQVFKNVRIQDAQASVESDRVHIFSIIDPQVSTAEDLRESCKCAALNSKVSQGLQQWFAFVVSKSVESRIEAGLSVSIGIPCKLADLLTQVGHYEKAEELLKKILHSGCAHVGLLVGLGNICSWGYPGMRDAEAMEFYGKAQAHYETLGVPLPINLLASMSTVCQRQGDSARMRDLFSQSEHLIRDHEVCRGILLRNMGVVLCKEGRHAEASKFFDKAEIVFRENNILSPSYAWLLHNKGVWLDDQGKCGEAAELHLQAEAVFEAASAQGHPGYAALQQYITRRSGLSSASA